MKHWFIPALAAVLLLNGCSWIKSWGDDDVDPDEPAKLVEFEPTLKVGEIWSTGVGDGLDKAGRQLRPVYVSGTLYAADYKGLLTAIDAESGNKRWEIKTKLPFTGGPGVSGKLLMMGTQERRGIRVRCINRDPVVVGHGYFRGTGGTDSSRWRSGRALY